MITGEIIFLIYFLLYLASMVLCAVIFMRKDLDLGFWCIFFLACPILNTIVAIRHRKYLHIATSFHNFIKELNEDEYN